MHRWRQALLQGYQPWLRVYCLPYDIDGPIPAYLPGLVSAATRSKVSAFVFDEGQAGAAITDLDELRRVVGIS
jgi:hypothetical protein